MSCIFDSLYFDRFWLKKFSQQNCQLDAGKSDSCLILLSLEKNKLQESILQRSFIPEKVFQKLLQFLAGFTIF